MQKTLNYFLAGSSGGPNGLTPQHVLDMIASASDEKLLEALIAFTNMLLSSKLSTTIREVIFGGRPIALQKKDGGICPIAVGYTLRRLAAKCANGHIIERRSIDLGPIQVGVRVSGGAEAAVHSIRRVVDNLPDHHVLVKLDFVNVFNSVSRYTILESMAQNMLKLYKFVLACHYVKQNSCSENILFHRAKVPNKETHGRS